MLFSYEKFHSIQNKSHLNRIFTYFYLNTANALNIVFLEYLFVECFLLPCDFEQIFDLKKQFEILVSHLHQDLFFSIPITIFNPSSSMDLI